LRINEKHCYNCRRHCLGITAGVTKRNEFTRDVHRYRRLAHETTPRQGRLSSPPVHRARKWMSAVV